MPLSVTGAGSSSTGTDSAPSFCTRLPVVPSTITRSGLRATIASTLGVKPDSLVRGACGGVVELTSTAVTWLPAPIAYSISVAVGDSEMIASGRCGTCTLPSAALIVTGKPLAAAALAVLPAAPGDAELAQPEMVIMPRTVTAATARGRRVNTRMMIILPDRGGRSAPATTPGGIEQTALPPRTGRRTRARRPGSSPARGHHRCGTAPGSHRLRWASRRPGRVARDTLTLPRRTPAGDSLEH